MVGECLEEQIKQTRILIYVSLYKRHFHKQCQAEIGKKLKQKLSNTLRLNFCYLKIICFFHPGYQQKIIGGILKNEQKTSASALMKVF